MHPLTGNLSTTVAARQLLLLFSRSQSARTEDSRLPLFSGMAAQNCQAGLPAMSTLAAKLAGPWLKPHNAGNYIPNEAKHAATSPATTSYLHPNTKLHNYKLQSHLEWPRKIRCSLHLPWALQGASCVQTCNAQPVHMSQQQHPTYGKPTQPSQCSSQIAANWEMRCGCLLEGLFPALRMAEGCQNVQIGDTNWHQLHILDSFSRWNFCTSQELTKHLTQWKWGSNDAIILRLKMKAATAINQNVNGRDALCWDGDLGFPNRSLI